jgi:hypothetical protein
MKKCRIKKGWDEAGKTGTFYIVVSIEGMNWAVVVWDGEEDPDLCKAAGIEIEETKFVSL